MSTGSGRTLSVIRDRRSARARRSWKRARGLAAHPGSAVYDRRALSILRSAEAFGAGGVVLGEGTVSPFNPKVVRASAGSVFRLPLARAKLSEALDQMKELSLRLVATASHKGTPLDQAKLSMPLAIFVGSEGAGVSRDLIKAMDEVVAIPQAPQVDSLNVGVAASIVLYEVARQRK